MTVVGSRLWWPACIGLVLLLIAPLFIVEVPPIQDYPNHLARLYVLAFGEGDPVLSTMYAPRWSINPNLAIDIIGPPLMHLLPLHVAGRVLLALALLLPLAGVVAYARAAFGAWSWWSLAGGTVAYNAIFILGFLNLLIGVGVALLGAAAWIGLRERHPALAVAGGAAMSVVVFFCHFIGELFFALLIGAEEAVRAWRLWRTGRLTARDLAVVATFPAIALAPALVLYVLSPISNSTGPTPSSADCGKSTSCSCLSLPTTSSLPSCRAWRWWV